MLNVVRNLIGIIAAFAAALLLTGGAQEAFRRLAPLTSNRLVLGLDIGTYFGFVLFGVSFFLVGLFARRWIRSRAPLLWVVLPVLAMWFWMHAGVWFMLTCNSQFIAICVMTYSLLVIPLGSGLLGYSAAPYLMRRSRSDS